MKTKCPLCKNNTVEPVVFVPTKEINNKTITLEPIDTLFCSYCNEYNLDLEDLIKIDIEFCDLILNEPIDGLSFLFCRKTLGISRKEVSSELGVSEETVKSMENTKSKLPKEINTYMKSKSKALKIRDTREEDREIIKHIDRLITKAKNEETKKKLKLN